jgi:hypothetical protein
VEGPRAELAGTRRRATAQSAGGKSLAKAGTVRALLFVERFGIRLFEQNSSRISVPKAGVTGVSRGAHARRRPATYMVLCVFVTINPHVEGPKEGDQTVHAHKTMHAGHEASRHGVEATKLPWSS